MGDIEGGERGPARTPQQRYSATTGPLARTDSMPMVTPVEGTHSSGIEPLIPCRDQQTAA